MAAKDSLESVLVLGALAVVGYIAYKTFGAAGQAAKAVATPRPPGITPRSMP